MGVEGDPIAVLGESSLPVREVSKLRVSMSRWTPSITKAPSMAFRSCVSTLLVLCCRRGLLGSDMDNGG